VSTAQEKTWSWSILLSSLTTVYVFCSSGGCHLSCSKGHQAFRLVMKTLQWGRMLMMVSGCKKGTHHSVDVSSLFILSLHWRTSSDQPSSLWENGLPLLVSCSVILDRSLHTMSASRLPLQHSHTLSLPVRANSLAPEPSSPRFSFPWSTPSESEQIILEQ
jgi:hypothetical protein